MSEVEDSISLSNTGGMDYEPVEEVVTFSVGSFIGAIQCFNVTIFDDGVSEPPETFFLSLSSTEEVGPNRDLLTLTILDASTCIHTYLCRLSKC